MSKEADFKRAWNILARTRTPEGVAFGSWLAPGYSRDLDSREFGVVENLLRVNQDDVILDLGCGALARALTYFGQKGFHVVGVDISTVAVAKAGKSIKSLKVDESVDLVVADAELLPFREASFDKVVAGALFSHFPSKYSIVNGLKEVRYCIKDNGLCYLGWWLNLYSPFSSLLVFANRLGFIGKAKRIQLLTFKGSKEILHMCEQAGLVVTKTINGSFFWYVFYLFPKFIHRWNERLLGVLRESKKQYPKFSLPPFFFDLIICARFPDSV